MATKQKFTTSSELVKRLREETGLSDILAKKIVTQLIEDIKDEIVNKENSVKLTGFGTLRLVRRNERLAMSPRTQEVIAVPAKKAITFKPYQSTKKELNPGAVSKKW
ncbi:HU family DNA-binding protein [Pediococcus pentosaceus]|uniref:HU family DNA-binding protein n=1 Tax=Pediococcus pentosaceus TaxID=1255 RepID=UPI00223BE244|nr:HU family DNA-binding protein [Pediococcus pentosaceus]MCT1178703.1 HU family DNA-binding protein [Pediococcus pentosaceus]